MRDGPKYDSAETLFFLELIEKLLVSASGTTRSPPGLSGWELTMTLNAIPTEGSDNPGSALPRPDIIVILVDALRVDYLGAYGFLGPISPEVDRLAWDSIFVIEISS